MKNYYLVKKNSAGLVEVEAHSKMIYRPINSDIEVYIDKLKDSIVVTISWQDRGKVTASFLNPSYWRIETY